MTFFTQDQVGRAKYINGHGDDIPLASLRRNQREVGIDTGGIGYAFSVVEVGQAQMAGVSLSSEGAMAARSAFETFVDDVAFLGNAEAGTTGLFNDPGVTSIAASALWAAATADQILADINGALTATYTSTSGMQMANTIRLPIAAMAALSVKRLSDHSEMTVLEYVRKANLYTVTTGQPLDIMGSTRLTNKMNAAPPTCWPPSRSPGPASNGMARRWNAPPPMPKCCIANGRGCGRRLMSSWPTRETSPKGAGRPGPVVPATRLAYRRSRERRGSALAERGRPGTAGTRWPGTPDRVPVQPRRGRQSRDGRIGPDMARNCPLVSFDGA
ncbi:major capsid family protein [Paracoccus sp. p4-l81]|uniref:major capsid family protein n=1 Tax=Paracoccus sp. p4-l81 TaxID=3342806 RepID=UPI0035BAECC7